MTGYKYEDSTYKGYDLETTQEEEWTVRVYKNGERLFTISCRRREVAIKLAKFSIEVAEASLAVKP
jgi:hypothetical protein